jgi:hypothetical protein
MTNRRSAVERSNSSRITNSLYVGISASKPRTRALKVLLSEAASVLLGVRFVLLLASANVANLQLARAAAACSPAVCP